MFSSTIKINSYSIEEKNTKIDISVIQNLEKDVFCFYFKNYKHLLTDNCIELIKNTSNIIMNSMKKEHYTYSYDIDIKNIINVIVYDFFNRQYKNNNPFLTYVYTYKKTNTSNNLYSINNIMLIKAINAVELLDDTTVFTQIETNEIEKKISTQYNFQTISQKNIFKYQQNKFEKNNIYIRSINNVFVNKNIDNVILDCNTLSEKNINYTQTELKNLLQYSTIYDGKVIRSEGIEKVFLPIQNTDDENNPIQPIIIVNGNNNLIKQITVNTNINNYFSIKLISDVPIASISNLPKHVQYYQPTTTLSGYLYNQKEHEMLIFFENGESMYLILKSDGITKHLI